MTTENTENKPEVPKAKAKALTKKNAPRALKTFHWCAKVGDTKIEFLAGKKVIGLPSDLVDSYREVGLIEPEPKDEDEEE